MKPANKEERSKAFLNFMLFFIITIAIIITTVFFSVQVPFKQNDQLLKQMNAFENERMILDSFSSKMQETMSLLNNANSASENDFITESAIKNNLTEMLKMISDSISEKSLYTNVITNLSELLTSRKQLNNANGKYNACQETIKTRDLEISKWKEAYDRLNNSR